ncbi:hypothetical protein [Marivita hallyeonensis]|uniref:Uncharacterized protein n=1 Tax=Marivita hallyeonensis TaxID=996342 RepID=A0A1M5VS72_9RHOB|nr:hypothetical protein [Marivita hallyeonensis]SHH78121.1 hypothetical protein SAMN05443551_3046 [Marivita hallyeonensis]
MNADFERRIARLQAKAEAEIPQPVAASRRQSDMPRESSEAPKRNLLKAVALGAFLIILIPTLAILGTIFFSENGDTLLQIIAHLAS